MKEIKLFKSPWKSIKLIFLCSIFVFGGIFLLRQSEAPKWIGWLNICFFGLGYPVALFHLADRRPQIIINEIGIFDRTTYSNFINWSVIQNAYLIDIHKQKFICLIVDENYEPSRRKGNFKKRMSTFSKSIGAQELNISLGQIQIDELRLTEFIQMMIQAKPEDRRGKMELSLLR